METRRQANQEFQYLEYPFSGIIRNWNRPNLNFNPTDFSEVYNCRYLAGGAVSKRSGETYYDATGISGTPTIQGIFQFQKEKEVESHFIIQGGDDLYEADNAPPATGNLDATTLLSGTGSSEFGDAVVFDDEFIYTAGSDYPQIWAGTSPLVDGFKKTVDNEVTFYDFIEEVTDSSTTTHAPLDSFDTAGNGDYFYVGYRRPISAIIITMGTNKNDVASVLTVKEWTGSAWSAVSNDDDGTDVAGDTLKQSGTISFDTTVGSAKPKLIDGVNLYWYRCEVDTQLSATVDIATVEVTCPFQTMVDLWDGQYRLIDGFVWYDASVDVYRDMLPRVVDEVDSTYAALASVTSSDYLHFGTFDKPRAFRIEVAESYGNTETASIDMEFWNGASWTDVSSPTENDDTSSNSKTMAQTGDIDFSQCPATASRRTLGGSQTPKRGVATRLQGWGGKIPLYWFRIKPSADFATGPRIKAIRYIPDMAVDYYYKHCTEFKDRLVLGNKTGAENSIRIGAYLQSGGLSGPDTIEIGFAGGAVNAIKKFYNELFVGTKERLYMIEGYDPSTYGTLRIPGSIGVWAPRSVEVIPTFPTEKGMRSVVLFVSKDGVYYFDGITATKVWGDDQDDLQDFWDTINTARIDNSYSTYLPSTREYLLQVSYGTSQTTHNRTIVVNCRNGGVSIYDWPFACLTAIRGSSDEDLIYAGEYSTGKVSKCYDGTYLAADGSSAINGYVKTIDNDYKQVMAELQCRGIGIVTKAETCTLTIEGFIDGKSTASAIDDSSNTSKTVSLANSGFSMKIANINDVSFNFYTLSWKFSNNVASQGFTLYKRSEQVRDVRWNQEAYP